MNINPIAFSIFGMDIRWYGILIAIGALLGVYFTIKLAIKRNISEDNIINLVLIMFPLGLIGARAYYVAFRWNEYYSSHLDEIFAIRNGGIAIYGAILTGIIIAYFYCKIKKIKFLDLADSAIPGLALAQGIGRWGNFINGEAHGNPTNLPWAIEVDGIYVHPTFLYESIIDVSIFLFLYFYLAKREKFSGELFATYAILYGIGRFLVEGMRTDSLYIGIFRISQIVSIAMIIFGVIFFMYNKINKKPLI